MEENIENYFLNMENYSNEMLKFFKNEKIVIDTPVKKKLIKAMPQSTNSSKIVLVLVGLPAVKKIF